MNRIYQLYASLLYIALFFALFPWYQYVLDIDAISYIHVAERFAKGEFMYSVNGYWSPLISWLLVPFIKGGFDPVLSAKYLNGLLGLVSLLSCFVLINKFRIAEHIKKILPFVLAVLFLSYAFYELCADLLQICILLLYLNLVFSKDFIQDNIKIVFAGVLGAIAYYAKAYNFPFFLSHFVITAWVLLKKSDTPAFWKTFIVKTALAFTVFFLFTLPYIAILSHKYGHWMINSAGKLNTSWFLSYGEVDHSIIAAEPPFGNATSYWDEPTFSTHKLVGPFTSLSYFFKEVKWTIANAIKFMGILNLMSILTFGIIGTYILYLYKRTKQVSDKEWLLFLTFLLYPAGYLLIFIEWRYVWIIPVLLIIMGSIMLTYCFDQFKLDKKAKWAMIILLCISFLYQPINELKELRNNNKDVNEIAAAFNKEKISGNIFLHFTSFEPYAKTVVLCYLTHNKLYGPARLDYNYTEFMEAVNKYQIRYYIYYYNQPNEKELFLQSAYAKAGTKVYEDIYPGVIVVQFK